MEIHQIDRYQIKSELGRGGMATVYLAYDPKFRREVALKVLPREFLHDPTFRTRFEREGQTIANLEHPAIVPVYDIGEDNGQPFMVMRLLDGGTLTDRLKQGPLLPLEISDILNRLTPALDEAHRQGIIHRDLKPDNILFDQRNEPFLADFGIAKLTERGHTLTTGGMVIGTPAYISPEQASGEGEVDGRSDIYSLGVILFEMLTGQPPFRSNTAIGLIMKHLSEPVPAIFDIKADLPELCQAIITKVLAKDREERYATATALATAFAEAIDPDIIPWPDMDSIFSDGSTPKQTTIPPEVKVTLPSPPAEVDTIECPKCGVVNPPQMRFCLNCSRRLKVDCTLCHTENRVDTKKCIKCGAPFKLLQTKRLQSTAARQQAVADRVQALKGKEARQIRQKLKSLFSDLLIRRKRASALDQLNQLASHDLEVLSENLFNDPDPETRYEDARLLSQICNRTEVKMSIRRFALSTLIDAVNDTDPKVRQYAQDALQRIEGKRPREVSDLFTGLMGWLKGE